MDRITFYLRENIRLILGLAVVIFLVILAAVAILGRSRDTEVAVNDNKFKVEVAKSEKEKQIGLSDTKELADNQGMLFVFDKPDYYSFWMKGMEFPIDIIYINGDKVTTVIPNAPVPTDGDLRVYQPKEKSDKVLEINAGLAKKYNIKEGSTIDINNL
jgi:uncharacterized protein